MLSRPGFFLALALFPLLLAGAGGSAQTMLSHGSTSARLGEGEKMRIAEAVARAQGRRGATPRTSTADSGIIETIAGTSPFQQPIEALDAGLGRGQGVVGDSSGNLYVSIYDLRTVLKIDPAGNASVYAGEPLSPEVYVANGDGGPATQAALIAPQGLAMDAAGNLYIADNGSFTVREVVAATGTITTVAGNGIYGHSGDGGQATSAELSSVQSLALDGAGDLFISEQTGYGIGFIREVNLSTGIISTIAGADGTPTCSLSTVSCPATAVGMNLANGPSGLAYQNGILYAGLQRSYGLGSGAVIAITLSTGLEQVIAGGGYIAEVNNPNIAIDSQGNLDIVDQSAVILQLPAGGTTLNVIAGHGNMPGYSGDGGPATSAELDRPSAITFTPTGNIVFADTDRIRQIAPDGIISTLAGDGTANEFGDGGPAQEAGLDLPEALALDGQGNLFISDFSDNVVREVSRQNGTITTIAGNGEIGYGLTTTPTSLPGDGGPATQTPVSGVTALAFDGRSKLYVGGYDQGVRVVDTTTGTIATLNDTLFVTGGMVFDGQHTLYVSATDVYAVDVTTGASTLVAGGGDSFANGIPALQAILSSQGLALDGNGNLYIADSRTDSVRIVNLATGTINTFAGGTGNTGSGDGGPASAANFYTVGALSYDGANHLYIVDPSGCVVRQVDLTTGIITTAAGNGYAGFTGDGGAATAARLDEPAAVIADARGDLYIADTGNNRVRGIVQPLTPLTGELTASTDDLVAGTSVTLTATLNGAQAGTAPTGSFTFLDGNTSLGTGTLAAATSSGSYVATLTNSTLAVGTHSITAQYAGDANYVAVTTAAVVLTVTAPVPPSYTVAASPGSLSIAQGGTGSTVLSITGAGGFSQAVSFSCGTGLPTGVSCSFSPATVTPNGTAAATTTLTITTTGTSTAALRLDRRPVGSAGGHWWLPTAGTSLACLLIFSMPRRRLGGLWMAIVLVLLCAGTNGCGSGGGGNGGSGGGTNPDATPPGTYSIHVATSAGSGSSALNQPLTLSLTVTE